MQLRMYTDYALRALIYLGTHEGGPVPASEIAAAYGISPDHVAKATKALTRAGVLRATRGLGGGVELNRPAHEIALGPVVRLMEGDDGLVECFAPDSTCRITAACQLRVALASARDAFFRSLDGVTLADILPNRPQLVRLLRTPRHGQARRRTAALGRD